MAKSGTQIVRTMCPMNCHPTMCGMLAEIDDGKLVGVSGDKDNPDSQGFLCVRGQASSEIISNPKRLLTPMIRDRREDDAWREAGWDEALDFIAAKIDTVGREATALWPGHGNIANSYGVYVGSQLLTRFANLYGCQNWSPAMICWGLGGFGLGLTGALETSTKEDMSAHSKLILLWGANLASQPNTARHIAAAKKNGVRIITIDVRHTEATAQSDEVFLIRPGTDAALALALMNVIISNRLHDGEFIADHTVGFDELETHVAAFTPEWAAAITGIAAEKITSLAHIYAKTHPAMILIGGSSLHKGANGWQAARAISCLPALIGSFGVAGGGLGPRHGATSHGAGLGDITQADQRPPGRYIPNQMAEMTASLTDGRVRALMLFGCNMLSSFSDTTKLAAGLDRTELIVCHDLFMNETSRRFADVVLPGTAWLEDVGAKRTNTHIYLVDRALEPEGETRPVQEVLKGLADRLGIDGYYPWPSQDAVIDAILDHPSTGHATVAGMRANGGHAEQKISPVAYPTHKFHTPSGKVEFVSTRAAEIGLPALPDYLPPTATEYPLVLCHGRTLTHFHSFYDHGQALPTLAARDPGPRLWISREDAANRELEDGTAIRIFNANGEFAAAAHVTDRIPPGVVWIRDGWAGANSVTSGSAAVPDEALALFPFTTGQSTFEARVEVAET